MRLSSTSAAHAAARLPRALTLAVLLAGGTLTAASLSIGLAGSAHAQGTALATVNGKPVTEADLKMAETELGPELAPLPPPSRRRILLEYVIENQIFSDAAEGAKLATGTEFDERMKYWRRRALRDLYFEKTIKASVKDEDAKKFYDEQVKAVKPEEEVKASHILVEEEAKAKEIAEKIAKGGDFVALAKEFSKDPGSKENGGDLGFFSKGQMVPEFEAAAFALEKGKVSAPVKSNFGWHVIKLEEKRLREPPPFDGLKERIVNSLLQKKAQTVGADLRNAAKIEYVDADIKKAVEAEKAAATAPAPAATPNQSKPPAKK